MTPLTVSATLGGAVHLPGGGIALDSLLMAARALVDGLPAPLVAENCTALDIPIIKSDCGRFYLASLGAYEIEAEELRYTNRKPTVEQYQTLANRDMKRVQISVGANKGYRIPRPCSYLRDDTVRWWCVGTADKIRALLPAVTHLGKRRAVGWGRVLEWVVAECEPWPGFPVVRDGKPLRPLPENYPGLIDPPLAYRTLLPPYWDHAREQLCAVPSI